MKIILHIDLNAFFAQAEILKNPSLSGKPIAVGYDSRRGVLSTASYEARKYGVSSGMPVSMAREKCPSLILVASDYPYYSRLSKGFMSYLHRIFPILEQASIDECYVDATSVFHSDRLEEELFDLQMSIYRNTQLKCSIGCSYNRFLAKMASDMKKPLGITIIHKEDIPEMIWPLAIKDMFGIGKKTYPRLEAIQIKTIGDLARTDSLEAKKILGSLFVHYRELANGYGSDELDTSAFDPKSISAERTFKDDVTDFDDVKSMLSTCASEVYQELIFYGKMSDTVVVKLRNSDFITKSKRRKIDHMISSKEELLMVALNIYESFYQGEPLRLVGLGLEHVVDGNGRQKPEKKEETEENTIFFQEKGDDDESF